MNIFMALQSYIKYYRIIVLMMMIIQYIPPYFHAPINIHDILSCPGFEM